MANIGTASNRKILDIFNAMKIGDLNLRPSFQRKLVWNNTHKESFIDTILKGLPFPEVYFADGEIDLTTRRSKTLVVDGQQRLSTIHQYITGDRNFILKKILLFKELTASQQTNFYDYVVVVRDLGRIEEGKIIEIFKRINSVQYALNSIEIQNALYEGEFISTAKNIMKNSKFSDLEIISESEYSRMRDWEYILSIMSTVEEGGYFNSTKEIDNYIQKYDEMYPNKDQISNEIVDVIQLILDCDLNYDSIWFRKSTTFTLIVELIKFKRKYGLLPDMGNLKLQLEKLENDILVKKSAENDFAVFYKYMYSGTASRTARVKRGELLERYLDKLK